MAKLDSDYEVALAIRNQIIPNALLWFLGEAGDPPEYDEYDEDEDDDEDEGGDDLESGNGTGVQNGAMDKDNRNTLSTGKTTSESSGSQIPLTHTMQRNSAQTQLLPQSQTMSEGQEIPFDSINMENTECKQS